MRPTRRGTLRRTCRAFWRDRRRRKAKSSSSSGRPPPPRPSPKRNSTAFCFGALESLSVKDAAAAVSAQTGAPRRQVYARALTLAGARPLDGPLRQIRRESAAPTASACAPNGSPPRWLSLKGYRILARRFSVDRRRDRHRRAARRCRRFCRSEGAAGLDEAAIAISEVKRRRISQAGARLAHPQSLGDERDAARRRRFCGAGTPSATPARRLSAGHRLNGEETAAAA